MWFDAYSVGLLNKLRKIIFFVVAKSEKKNIKFAVPYFRFIRL